MIIKSQSIQVCFEGETWYKEGKILKEIHFRIASFNKVTELVYKNKWKILWILLVILTMAIYIWQKSQETDHKSWHSELIREKENLLFPTASQNLIHISSI